MVPGCIVEYKVFCANIRSLTSQAESPPSCPTPRHHRARVLGSEPLDRSEEPQCWAELGALRRLGVGSYKHPAFGGRDWRPGMNQGFRPPSEGLLV